MRLRAFWLIDKVVIINEIHRRPLPSPLYYSIMRRDHCCQWTLFTINNFLIPLLSSHITVHLGTIKRSFIFHRQRTKSGPSYSQTPDGPNKSHLNFHNCFTKTVPQGHNWWTLEGGQHWHGEHITRNILLTQTRDPTQWRAELSAFQILHPCNCQLLSRNCHINVFKKKSQIPWETSCEEMYH